MFTMWELMIIQNLVNNEIDYWVDQHDFIGESDVIDGEIKILQNINTKIQNRINKIEESEVDLND